MVIILFFQKEDTAFIYSSINVFSHVIWEIYVIVYIGISSRIGLNERPSSSCASRRVEYSETPIIIEAIEVDFLQHEFACTI